MSSTEKGILQQLSNKIYAVNILIKANKQMGNSSDTFSGRQTLLQLRFLTAN